MRMSSIKYVYLEKNVHHVKYAYYKSVYFEMSTMKYVYLENVLFEENASRKISTLMIETCHLGKYTFKICAMK